MKLYQIMVYNKNREYGDDYIAFTSRDTDGIVVFFSEDAAKAYCEEQNLARAEALREKNHKEALRIYERIVTNVREHNALVDAGVRQGPKQSGPDEQPKLEDFPIDPFLSKRWPEYIYEEFNSMDEPVS